MNRRDTAATLFLIAFPFLFYFPVTLGTSAWYTRDISRVYHPFAVELSRALNEGRLPLWTPYLQGGFPLLAEGQVAAFYLPQLLLVKFLPAHFAISYEMLLHIAFAGVGMYYCTRTFGSSTAGALVAGFAFSFNGFMLQKLYHTPILLTAAWLPWLIFLFEGWQRARKRHSTRAGFWLLFCVLAIAMQWLAGSAQTAFLNSIVLGVFGLVGELYWNRVPGSGLIRTILRAVYIPAIPLFLGTALAAVQLLPTAELLSYSTRARGLDERLLTLYSYSSDSLAQYIFPFSQGEPSDDNVELWGYCGLAILLLALAALRSRRDSQTMFWFAFGLVALSLTFGAGNPLFQLLSRLPIFNLFRVPARYAFPLAFAIILLAAKGFDEFANHLPISADKASRWLVGVITVFTFLELVVVWAAYTESLEFWLSVWNILPWIIGSLALIIILLGYKKRINRGILHATMIGLVVFDLSAYAATFLSTTVAQLTPPANITQVPRSLSVLGAPSPRGRVLTDETIWPSVPALRASLYPNFGMLYEREMAHAYTPLWFDANENYFFNLTPALLNLLNVRYFLIPLEPRFTDRRPMPYGSLSLDVVNNEVAIPPTTALSIQIDSFVEDTSTLADDTPVAELVVGFDDESKMGFPLRTGFETADWDDARKRTQSSAHSTRTIVGFVRSFGRTFEGNVYRAQFDFSPARRVTSINVHALIPPARITVERIALVDEKGKASSLAALTAKDEFLLRYMSDTVAIWENVNVFPRAFVVHNAKVMESDQVFENLRKPEFRGDQVVLLSEGQPLEALEPDTGDHVEITRYSAQRVSIEVEANRAGYLVLADTFYPGWTAYVDGNATPIYRADSIFRAIPIQAGHHSVLFEYFPNSLLIGLVISIVSSIVLVGISVFPGTGLA